MEFKTRPKISTIFTKPPEWIKTTLYIELINKLANIINSIND